MVVHVDGLFRDFGTFRLGPIDLRLEAGQYTVLLGPSGSGKTLLLQTLAGIFAPDRGRISLGGHDVSRVPAERRGIGLVFQQAALFPHYSVRGNIEYGLRARRVAADERRRRVQTLVERLGLSPIVDRPVPTLSGGEAQRVAIARALAPEPALLLLDEPLSHLDFQARRSLQAELSALHAELGMTTLHVTHDMDEARLMGSRWAVMLRGRIVQQGQAEAVLSRPASAEVAGLLAQGPEHQQAVS